jgi:aryl-alcohol dehydrogenase-like predicted oxidoreductase
MTHRTLGTLETSPIGLGCMGMTWAYGAADEDEAVATIHRALELGCTFLDTAELYGPHTNEELVGRAVRSSGVSREDVVVATKFGIVVGPNGRSLDGSAAHVRRSAEASLQRLGLDYIDLYYQHRPDPSTPIEETVGALAELVAEGKIRHIGLSEAAPERLRRAAAVHPIAALQSEYSLWTRDPEAEVLPLCRELGIGFVAYSPLGRGFLSGRFRSLEDLEQDDWRRTNPRLQGENLGHNQQLAAKVRELALEKGCTPGQLALAWVLAQGEHVVPIPGTKRRRYLEENWAAQEVELTPEDLDRIASEVPVAAGARYDEVGMRSVNV